MNLNSIQQFTHPQKTSRPLGANCIRFSTDFFYFFLENTEKRVSKPSRRWIPWRYEESRTGRALSWHHFPLSLPPPAVDSLSFPDYAFKFLHFTFQLIFTLDRVNLNKIPESVSQFCEESQHKQLQTAAFLQLQLRTEAKLRHVCRTLFLTGLDSQLLTDQQTERKQKSGRIELPSVTFKVFPAPALFKRCLLEKEALQPIWFFFTFSSFLVSLLQLCLSVLLPIFQLLFCSVLLCKGSALQNKPVPAVRPRDSAAAVKNELLWESITKRTPWWCWGDSCSWTS